MIFLILALLALPITWLVSSIFVAFSSKVNVIKWEGMFLTYCAALAIISLPAMYRSFLWLRST